MKEKDECETLPLLASRKSYLNYQGAAHQEPSSALDPILMESAPPAVSLASLCLCILTSDASRGLLFPTLWLNITSRGGSLASLSNSVAVFNVGKMIGAPLQGLLSEWLGREAVLILGNIFIFLGALMYSIVSNAPLRSDCVAPESSSSSTSSNAIFWIILSQGILGIGAGSLGLIRSCIMDMSSDSNTTIYMSYISILQYCAYIFMPIVGSLLTLLAPSSLSITSGTTTSIFDRDYSISLPICTQNSSSDSLPVPLQTSFYEGYVNEYNIVGLFLLLLSIATIFTIQRCLQLPPAKHSHIIGGNLPSDSLISQTTSSAPSTWPTSIVICCLLNFITKGAVGIFETLALSFVFSQHHWSVKESGILFGMSGVIGDCLVGRYYL
jgi:MFS family permease